MNLHDVLAPVPKDGIAGHLGVDRGDLPDGFEGGGRR